MKALPAALLLSLALNGALAWLAFRPAGSIAPGSAAGAATPVTKPTALIPPPKFASAGVGSAPVPATPAAALRDRLRALGLPEETIRAAVRAQLEAPRLARQRACLAQAAQATPWFQSGATTQNLTREQTRELRELRDAERDELVHLFGPTGAITARDVEAFAFLPEEKAARLAALERDYADLRRDASGNGPGSLPVAGADERLRLLAAEHQRDLATLLSPAERQELELRESDTARNLVDRFTYLNVTDAETRAIYALQKTWDDQYRVTSIAAASAVTPEGRAARDAATKQLDAEIEATLGAERFADWQQQWRLDRRALGDAQRRFNLPATTVDAVAQLPLTLSAAANQVLDQAALSNDEKKAALAKLATDARAQVRSLLGADIGDAYLATSGRMWVDFLDRGMAYTLNPGGGTSVRSVTALSPPTAPPPPAKK